MDKSYLDQFRYDAEQEARAQGWRGPWELQNGDLDTLVGELGRKLTAEEGEYLGITDVYTTHVDWE